MPEPMRSQRSFTALFLTLVAAVLLFSDKGQIEGDGVVRWNALVTLMEEHRSTPERYTLVQPLLAAPLYAVGDAGYRLRHGDEEARNPEAFRTGRVESARRMVQRFNKLVAFGVALWLFLTLRSAFGLAPREAAAGTMFLLFGSWLIPHTADFYSEALWTLLSLVVLGYLVAPRASRPSTATTLEAAAAGALAVLLNPVLLAILSLVAAVRARRVAFRERGLPVLLGLSLGAGLCMLENAVRRGRPLDFGYAGESFSTSFPAGLVGQLLSPTRGLIFFAPAFFLGLVLLGRRAALDPDERSFVTASLGFSALLVLSYSKWHAWHGATYWGPRFLLPLSILGALFLAVSVRRLWPDLSRGGRAALLVTGLLSVAVYKAGVGVGLAHLLPCLAPDPFAPACYWNWSFLPYASFLDRADLVSMALHRSTAVELGGLTLFAGLLLWDRRRDSAA